MVEDNESNTGRTTNYQFNIKKLGTNIQNVKMSPLCENEAVIAKKKETLQVIISMKDLLNQSQT